MDMEHQVVVLPFGTLMITLSYILLRDIVLIELSNGNVALSNNVHTYPIVIINTSSYEIMTVMQMKKYIPSCSSMIALDERSFIFA